MFNSIIPVTDIPRIRPGATGHCYLYIVEWHLVNYWPSVNLESGIVDSKIKASRPWRKIQMYTGIKTQDKDSDIGTYTSCEVTGLIRATSTDIILKSYQMQRIQWVIVLKEKNGIQWLIGDSNSGAVLRSTYESNDSNRTLTLTFTWDSEFAPYVYNPQPTGSGDFSPSDFAIKDFF